MAEIYIDDPNLFRDEQHLYEFLNELHSEYEILDLDCLLEFFLYYERFDYYLTTKKFIANVLEQKQL